MSSKDMITTHREAVMCVKYNKSFKHVITASENSVSTKTESIRKLSNFNFQWTKTLYQNNLKNIAFFLHFSRAIEVISHL